MTRHAWFRGMVLVALVAAALAAATGRGKPAAADHTGVTSRPMLAVLGASFSAGIGTDHRPSLAWPADLGRDLGWDVKVVADPGAGYVRAGHARLGPMTHLLPRLHLTTLRPAVVMVQAGHDDIGVPAATETAHVLALLDAIRAESPGSRIVLVTVFRGRAGVTRATATDEAIVAAAHQVPGVLVVDPLERHWSFPTTSDGLHPSVTGHADIARLLAAALVADGVAHGSPRLRALPVS